MSNMSYCRFRNTVEDLEDCVNSDFPESKDEVRAYHKMARLCREFLSGYDEDLISYEED